MTSLPRECVREDELREVLDALSIPHEMRERDAFDRFLYFESLFAAQSDFQLRKLCLILNLLVCL